MNKKSYGNYAATLILLLSKNSRMITNPSIQNATSGFRWYIIP